MSKFTSGPWIRENVTNRKFDILDIEGNQVARVYMPKYAPGDILRTTVEGNAALIAAAPDLLEAAQLALKIAESWIHDQLDGTSSIDGALRHLDPVRAAIARARGEA